MNIFTHSGSGVLAKRKAVRRWTWVCVLGLLYQFLIRPITQALLLKYDVIMPSLDIEDLMALLSGMLGLGFYSMREKQDNVAR